MNKLLIAIVLVFVVGWVTYDYLHIDPQQVVHQPNSTANTNNTNEVEVKANLIVVDSVQPNDSIASPLVLSGKARGYWFFEASFPIELRDNQGNVIAIAIARAQDEWMTEDFVPFVATLAFVKPENSTSGALIFKKDNPSGESEFDDQLVIPVVFE